MAPIQLSILQHPYEVVMYVVAPDLNNKYRILNQNIICQPIGFIKPYQEIGQPNLVSNYI